MAGLMQSLERPFDRTPAWHYNATTSERAGRRLYHVHDVPCRIHDTSRENRYVYPESRVERPVPFLAGYKSHIFR
jgi:hypothetical protein